MLTFDVVSVFPELLLPFAQTGILSKAAARGLISFAMHNPRDQAPAPHHVVDDYPFGGGPGMVMKPEPLVECVESFLPLTAEKRKILITAPSGRMFDQRLAEELTRLDRVVIICGRYEGIDERVREILAAEYVSCGPYVLMGGEIAALAVIESVARLLPGVIGNRESLQEESYVTDFLEYPQYTRPWSYRGCEVPEVLRSGNHQEIKKYNDGHKRRL